MPDIASALDIALGPYVVAPTSAAESATIMGDGLSEFFWRSLVAKRLNLPAQEAALCVDAPDGSETRWAPPP